MEEKNYNLIHRKVYLKKNQEKRQIQKRSEQKIKEWIETRKAERGEKGMQIIQAEANCRKAQKDYKKV